MTRTFRRAGLLVLNRTAQTNLKLEGSAELGGALLDVEHLPLESRWVLTRFSHLYPGANEEHIGGGSLRLETTT